MATTTGSCLCGSIRYELVAEPLRVTHCHCSRCRKVRGTGHATNLVAPMDGVRYLAGRELLTEYRDPSAKYFAHAFCRVCGSSMPRLDPGRNIAIVPMGSFDEDPGHRPGGHIFVDSKAPWDEINDDLPQFPGAPPSL